MLLLSIPMLHFANTSLKLIQMKMAFVNHLKMLQLSLITVYLVTSICLKLFSFISLNLINHNI